MDDLDFEPVPVRVAGRFRPKTTKPSESAAAGTLQPSVAASNGSEGSHSVFGKSASENADIFSGLNVFIFLTKLQVVQCLLLPASHLTRSMREKTKVDGSFSEFEALDVVSEVPFQLEAVLKNFTQAQRDVHDPLSPNFGDSIAPNPTPNFQVNAENLAETTQLDEAVFGDAAHSEVCGKGRKSENGKASTCQIVLRSSKKQKTCDKSLLEIPEDEIDPQKLPIKDLIRLQEYRERLAIKEAEKSKTPASNQSAYNEFHREASHNEENFGFEQYRSSDEDQADGQKDTELFYEGIEQFGSDFSMIAQLFPGRTRHQIKLKFKKEDRQNPLRINEAFRRHSKGEVQDLLLTYCLSLPFYLPLFFFLFHQIPYYPPCRTEMWL
ncbi:hypothetical protein M0R45_008236 [Rubus argutus]|uniref:SANT domain-containing protein n=1 Tax=Rubus argutus TaxID=59490 RepID=A0AAW1Y0M3_RUBAR